MSVSFSPVFKAVGGTVSSHSQVFTFGAVEPGVPLILTFLAINEEFQKLTDPNDTLVEHVAWSDDQSGIYTANFFMLNIIPGDTSVTLRLTGSADAVGVMGQPSAGAWSLLPPADYIDVPGEPGSVYANPQEISNTSVESYISAWLPTGRGAIYGAIFSHTYDSAAQTLDLQTVINGNFEESNLASRTAFPFGEPNDPLRIQAKCFVVETEDDPVEIRVNEGNGGEWRWSAALGGAEAARSWSVMWG